MNLAKETEEDMQIQLECQKDQPYIRLVTFLGAISVLIAVTAVILGLARPSSNFALFSIGLLLGTVGLLWAKYDHNRLQAIQEKADKQDKELDLAMRRNA